MRSLQCWKYECLARTAAYEGLRALAERTESDPSVVSKLRLSDRSVLVLWDRPDVSQEQLAAVAAVVDEVRTKVLEYRAQSGD